MERIEIALQRAREAFSKMDVSSEQREEALKNLRLWLSSPEFAPYQPQLQWLVETEKWELLLDSFYRILPFGTGGRRGPVGIGPNRINPYTVSSAVQGHADFLRSHLKDRADISVVIAYDVRTFKDLRKLYNPDLPNPLLDYSSKKFAQLAAQVYAANGITVWMLNPDGDDYLSTPELSFMIRHLKADAGLNVSASHNHPDDNGCKFFVSSGAQPVPPVDQQMLEFVEKVEHIKSIPFDEAVGKDLIRWITPADREEYVRVNLRLPTEKNPGPISVAYTPMHGTGDTSIGRTLRAYGVSVELLPSQATPDGSFPNVRYNIPNPEVPETLKELEEFAKKVGADLALSSDPDADRIGMLAPDSSGNWHFFTGNQISTVLTHYRLDSLRRAGRLPERPVIVKTEVTTDILAAIARDFGGECLGHLLVGFKYIAKALEEWENGRPFLGFKAELEQFVLGTEESHGVLLTPEIRDKDAAGGAIILAQLAAELKSAGKTIPQYLNEIYVKYGYFSNQLLSLVMEGPIGLKNIRSIQESLRNDPPEEINGIRVVQFFDRMDPRGPFGPILSETDRSSRNVLSFKLENGSRIILRPSGTEPKAKLYVELHTPPLSSAEELPQIKREIDRQVREMAETFALYALKRVGIDIPPYAIAASDLLPVEKKLALPKILHSWRQLVETDSPSHSSFLQRELTSLHPQGPELTARAVEQYISTVGDQNLRKKLYNSWKNS